MRSLYTSLGLTVLVGFVAFAQGNDPKEAAKPGEVELQFANGSVVRLALHLDKLDVQTRYGRLQIPLKDIQRIDFGVHLEPETARKIDHALRRLASSDYSERDRGGRELAGLGASAYPAVLQATKNIDQEVSRRAEKILADLRARFPEKELRHREDDIILTPGFTIMGRIATPTLKGQSEYFGSVQLQLSQLRQLRSLQSPGEVQIDVDAAQYGSTHGSWMDTGFLIEKSAALSIAAEGNVDIYPQTPGQYVSTPRGYGNTAITAGTKVALNPVSLRNFSGALLGRIGEAGEAFFIGERYDGTPGQEGKLYLHIVPSPWNNASTGSFKVRINARN